MMQPLPNSSISHLDLVLGPQPGAQFCNSGVRLRCYTSPQQLVMSGQFWKRSMPLRVGRGFASATATSKNLVDVRNAYLKKGRDFIGVAAVIHRPDHTLTQVLRIGLAHGDPL